MRLRRAARTGDGGVVAWEATLTGQLQGPGLNVAAVRALAEDLRSVASTFSEAPAVHSSGWQGEAALSYASWAARLVDVIDTAVRVAVDATAELREVSDAGERAATDMARLQGEVSLAGADPAVIGRVADQAAAVVRRQEGVERHAATRLMDLARKVSGAPAGVCRSQVVGEREWTGQQSRDLWRGVGDAAWDVGPGGVSALLRWATVPGWLNAYDGLDRWENDAKAYLDEWGGGRTDTATNRAAYASTIVLTALIPVPSGQTTAAARAVEATAAFAPAPADAAWVGKGGEWLSAADLRAVDEFHAAAVAAEPRITAIMDDVMVGLPTVTAAGRQYVLKSPESLRRKVATELLEDGGASSVGGVLSRLNDSVRHTFVSAEATFVADVNVVSSRLSAAGLTVTRWRSAWDGDSYRGVNSAWRDSSGNLMEIQFHTLASLWAKEFTHGWYEQLRALNVPVSELTRLRALQADVFRGVPRPSGVDSLIDPRRVHG